MADGWKAEIEISIADTLWVCHLYSCTLQDGFWKVFDENLFRWQTCLGYYVLKKHMLAVVIGQNLILNRITWKVFFLFQVSSQLVTLQLNATKKNRHIAIRSWINTPRKVCKCYWKYIWMQNCWKLALRLVNNERNLLIVFDYLSLCVESDFNGQFPDPINLFTLHDSSITIFVQVSPHSWKRVFLEVLYTNNNFLHHRTIHKLIH